MTEQDIWNSDATVAETLGYIIPHWIDSDIGISTVASIMQGGCNSGAYMPAVTYYRALETMRHYGDDVLQYIDDQLGELPTPRAGESWGGMACHYLSFAVELWASSVYYQLEDMTA
ncbi:MAG: hypothetical protein JGK24_28035 [Microcoleus sp. PH2017_29_MFU_D_A]|uniref:hypothetical protein n=1 Tax=Microcoleus sp. PH2017_29_MFU_D_A TaxID=2798839 RepID=UPI001E1A0FA7|nr:hypothetical protein [Microcoleus sp. PH2017_29_MFU_D_A]MCC3606968.1 hypothetical protein [Microcoleus sp. PH2017_29_MFU_D_A]